MDTIRLIRQNESHRLWKLIRDIGSSLGLVKNRPDSKFPIDHIVVGLEPSFYVSNRQMTIGCGDNSQEIQGRILYLSLPLCRILTLDELHAVLGHELAHLHPRSWWNPTHWGNRQSEVKADLLGAKVAGEIPMATALLKLHKYGQVWPSTRRGMGILNQHGIRLKNASLLFQIISKTIRPESFKLSKQNSDWTKFPRPLFKWMAHSFAFLIHRTQEKPLSKQHSSHPAIASRLKALSLSQDIVMTLTQNLNPASPLESSIQLISNHEGIETELTRRMVS